jgi:expansin (peptidoglycan-binding protein)
MGDGTYYNADGTGNCGFDKSADLMVGAMNHTDYAGSAVCGECVAITGPKGSVTIAIVDQCPECKPGDIDLSPQAFAKLDDLSAGRIPISWKVVSCGLPGPIAYHEKDGVNPYWSAIQIRNSNNAILKLEAMKNGAYEELMRVDYNYFLDASGLGNGPYQFRVTDVYGNVLEDSGIPLGADQTFPGKAQFPPCP